MAYKYKFSPLVTFKTLLFSISKNLCISFSDLLKNFLFLRNDPSIRIFPKEISFSLSIFFFYNNLKKFLNIF